MRGKQTLHLRHTFRYWRVTEKTYCSAARRVVIMEPSMAEERTLELAPTSVQESVEEGSIHFIGTATVIVRLGGFTILTDPNFLHRGEHVHLGYGLQSRRRTNPALELEQLPALDLVLLSHLHEDHFDRLVARDLDHTLPIVTTPQAARALAGKGFTRTMALSTWEPLRIHKGGRELRVTAMPGKHGPTLLSALLPAVMGSMLEVDTGDGRQFRLYISGDTLIHQQFRQIPRRFPAINLALLHLGGTRIGGVLLTMDARQGVEALKILAPQKAIPIHYNDYTVFKSSLKSFARAVHAAKLDGTVQYLRHGERYSFPLSTQRAARLG